MALIGFALGLPVKNDDVEYSGLCEGVNYDLLPLIGGCEHYIFCLFGHEMIGQCPEDTYFSWDFRDCVPGDSTICEPF